jgi:KaiC/GvpD/RAD55 family RecA-like ATPase
MDGGINEKSTTVVIGTSGAGKTTFATQFIRRGLEEGREGIFVSLDENKDQIIKEAVEMGWEDILDYLDDELLVFIDASGREFSNFIKKELPGFVEDWKGADARIVVDPLTPVMWSTDDHYEQRDLISFMLKQTRKVGTLLCTLEEHGTAGNLSGRETIIPMYLSDTVIHLRYRALEGGVYRMLKIVKCRSSRHSELSHPYKIVKGLGLIVQHGDFQKAETKAVPTALEARLGDTADLPPTAAARLRKALGELSDADLSNMDADELMGYIKEEYS